MASSNGTEKNGGAAAALLLRKSRALETKLAQQREEGDRLSYERDSLRRGEEV